MRRNPIGRQSKRQRKLLKAQLARIVPSVTSEHMPLWSLDRAPTRTPRTPRLPSRSRRSSRPY